MDENTFNKYGKLVTTVDTYLISSIVTIVFIKWLFRLEIFRSYLLLVTQKINHNELLLNYTMLTISIFIKIFK